MEGVAVPGGFRLCRCLTPHRGSVFSRRSSNRTCGFPASAGAVDAGGETGVREPSVRPSAARSRSSPRTRRRFLFPVETRKFPRDDRHRRSGLGPGPGAAIGHALQLRAGERGVGDAEAGQGSRGWLRLHEKSGKRHDCPGPPPGGGPRRLRRGDRARRAEAGLFQTVGPLGAAADGPGARPSGSFWRDQAARRGRRAAAVDVLPHVPGDGITAYLSNGGTLEHAQQIAGHASPKTTVDEIERIVI